MKLGRSKIQESVPAVAALAASLFVVLVAAIRAFDGGTPTDDPAWLNGLIILVYSVLLMAALPRSWPVPIRATMWIGGVIGIVVLLIAPGL